MEPIEQPMQEPEARPEKAGELKLLRTLINNYDGSPPSRVDLEKALESGVAYLVDPHNAPPRTYPTVEAAARALLDCEGRCAPVSVLVNVDGRPALRPLTAKELRRLGAAVKTAGGARSAALRVSLSLYEGV